MDRFEVAKLIGSANTKTWAQTHAFVPEDEGKRERYGALFAVFSLKSQEQEEKRLVEIAAFGREIITRFHELYFAADPNLAIHKRLEQAFTSIKKEYGQQVSFSGTAAVVLERGSQTALYMCRLGEAQGFLWRDGQLVDLFGYKSSFSPESVSGWLEKTDVFLLGTAQVFELVPQGSLQAGLQHSTLEQTSQILTPIVHGHEQNTLAALIMGRIKAGRVAPEGPVEKAIAKDSKSKERERSVFKRSPFQPVTSSLGRIFDKTKAGLKNGWWRLRSQALKRQSIAVRERGVKKSRKTALSVAVIFLLLLGVSVGRGLRRRQSTNADRKVTAVLETVQYNLDQAKQLAELNPGRAKSLLLEAQESLAAYKGEVEASPEIDRYEQEITQWLARVSREYRVDQAETFFDLSLIKDDFKAKRWGVTEQEVVILGQDVLATLDLDKKQSAVIAGGEEVGGADLVGSVSPWGIVVRDGKLVVVGKSEQRVIDDQDLGKVKPVDLVGYAGNAYVLDVDGDQIWRYAGLAAGLAKAQTYMKGEPELENAVSLAIDGSVWILFEDGSLVKYTRGVQDAFAVSGLDVSFGEPIRLFTDENQDNLYILDRQNTKVVVIAKTGEYQAQYIWPGIAGATDLLASEELGKIFLLTESRIYSLEIKN